MQRLYALAAELNVPITIHFQEVNQPDSPGTFNTGLKKFDAMLKAYPKTTFIGHADAFWANVSADYAEDTSYPKGPIKPGGVTDRFLGDYPNLYADMSANSGNNFLEPRSGVRGALLERHQNKLMFGSDCPCPDGRGGATGRCIARATLTQLKRSRRRSIQKDRVGERAAGAENSLAISIRRCGARQKTCRITVAVLYLIFPVLSQTAPRPYCGFVLARAGHSANAK